MNEEDQIRQLIVTKPKHFSRMIASNQNLWNWVLSKCDPNCIDNITRIYTALHPNEKILCPCGSNKPRKISSIYTGLRFCAKTGKCSAARLAVSASCIASLKNVNQKLAAQKRAQTSMSKHGVINNGQTAKAKSNHQKFYDDANASNIAIVTNQMSETYFARTGFKNPQKNPAVKLKSIQTCQTKYGTNNGNQIHFSKETYEFLTNPELFEQELIALPLSEICTKYNVIRSTIYKYHNNYGLNLIDPYKSDYERELSSFLHSLNIQHTENVRKLLKGQEIDIYIPDYNLAIEFDGLYWHSEEGSLGKCNKNYHLNKTKLCIDQGIHLIHIFEDEWISSRNVCKSIIKGYVNKQDNIIPARKCKVEEMQNKELKIFLNENHLQGWVRGNRAFVLKYKGEIVAAMTFGKPRYNKKIEWELLRLAFKCDIKIIGGSEKMWKYAIQELQPSSIVSYCDNRWFTGKIYKKLSFVKQNESGKPTYWYVGKMKRIHRSNFQKHKLVKMGYDKNLSESKIVRDIMGINKIWDCGQDTWIWKNETTIN